ncbi:MAG: hypothetical protein IJS02_03580 [Bacteroidales bacterium]|nr:hypothetical protein [Bacteroidales bacterium]
MASKVKNALTVVIIVLFVALSGFFYFKFLWVFSDGTKTGELNSVTYTGYVFKTFEGEIILSGYGNKSAQGGSVLSKNFKFSVADKDVANELIGLTGQRVTVHYKEYKGTLPWRGYERSIVDKVISSEPATRKGDIDEIILTKSN